jgi:hypothetical protein
MNFVVTLFNPVQGASCLAGSWSLQAYFASSSAELFPSQSPVWEELPTCLIEASSPELEGK